MRRSSTRRRRRPAVMPPPARRSAMMYLPSLLVVFSLSALSFIRPALAVVSTYLPLSYTIGPGQEECLYERIDNLNEHLTASVFVLSGEELRAAIVFEGPVAPVDLDLDTHDAGRKQKGKRASGGSELKRYLTRYDREGTKMFVNGKFGDSMMNAKPLRIAEMVDFEEEEEDYFDDYYMDDKQRERFNREHDLEHQHAKLEHPPEPRGRRMERGPSSGDVPPPPKKRFPGRGKEVRPEDMEEYDDDDFIRYREEARLENLRNEAMLDDDFVKLQLDKQRNDFEMKKKYAGAEAKVKDEEMGEGPERRKIADKPPVEEDGERKSEATRDEKPRRRLREETKLLAGEPYQKTVQVESHGWYRLCVHPKSHQIEVEMELRKSSLYGEVDRRTGHVPSFEEFDTHAEIRHLFKEEDDATVLAEEAGIQDEDLKASKEQLRILEKVYSDIITKQLEERRIWKWRTIKNQHIYSHLVLGNLVETVVYMAITGLQVYTIRKWFSGGPALGR